MCLGLRRATLAHLWPPVSAVPPERPVCSQGMTMDLQHVSAGACGSSPDSLLFHPTCSQPTFWLGLQGRHMLVPGATLTSTSVAFILLESRAAITYSSEEHGTCMALWENKEGFISQGD